MKLNLASKRSEKTVRDVVGKRSTKSLSEDAERDQDEKIQDDGKEKDGDLERGDELVKKKGTEKGVKIGGIDDIRARQLDTGDIQYIYRRNWWQVWLPKNPPPPAPLSLDDAPIIPIAYASIFSKLTYAWITPLMILGYQRSLQASDLWKMDSSREAALLSEVLDRSWDRRVKEAEEWNKKLLDGQVHPGLWRKMGWVAKAIGKGTEGLVTRKRTSESDTENGKKGLVAWYNAMDHEWRTKTGLREPNLAWALNDTFGLHFWLGGLFKVVGDTSQTMGPLLVKAIINFGKQSIADKQEGRKLNIGRGIGMAIGLFVITICSSVCQHQFFWRSMSTGVLARGALINSIYKRAVALTPRARAAKGFSHSALVNYVSTDVSRIDACAQWFHAIWTAPIQVTVCLIILLVQLGPSALAGFALFLLMVPLQERLMSIQFKIRSKSVKWTDERAKVILEVLGAMRVVKYFSYEIPFLNRLSHIRRKELIGVRWINILRSANIAMAFSVPVIAATLSFVTYTLTAHTFDAAIIFASFSLFQLLRQPLMFLPRALSALSDAQHAIQRLETVFHAEVMRESALVIDLELGERGIAVEAKGATFEWEESAGDDDLGGKGKGGRGGRGGAAKGKKGQWLKDKFKQDKEKPFEPTAPFKMKDINMSIPTGQLVAIVGPVGSGKSSLLQGLIGEMRRVNGQVTFGGRVGYCPQTAWIQNATLRDNILFGQPFDEDKYWDAVANSSLLPDLQVLPDGDLTEIGEKGINLSGGQKQRVNIARALYYNADVVIFDDPLSAVDAHVGKALFTDAILGALRARGKTVILVTHALHFLSQCDYIYTLDNGHIAEHGTYLNLIKQDGNFARLDREFGGEQQREQIENDAEEDTPLKASAPPALDVEDLKLKSKGDIAASAGKGRLEGRLMVAEKRTTGSVSWSIYGAYISAGRGYITMPLIIVGMVLMQVSSVMNSYTLVWWQANTFNRPSWFYQALYAGLGVAQATFTFAVGAAMDMLSDYVSRNLHHHAVRNVFHAPMTFFDTTPMGRILSIFGKDIDTIDNQLTVSMRLLVLTLASVFGSVIIITVLEHYFIIAAAFIFLGYSYFAAFYRASALEMKRLDALLRSLLYSHYSESLTGLPTIRSYGEVPRFLQDNQYYIDLENRALFLTITNQRWLAIRLDFMGACMVFLVAVFAVVGVSSINPAQIGLVLTYTTQLTQLSGLVTRQSAETENYMNSVERVVHYSRGDLIPQEAAHEIPAQKPDEKWPENGAIKFNDISMSYRPGLPNVLKGITLDIKGGEKIGVVGRTGAGKSSLMLALFRIVELNSGSITIDEIDISKLGLRDVRSKISIIPQDPLLFSGTIRSNLDPFNLYDDSHLWDALRRAYLVDTFDSVNQTARSSTDKYATISSEMGSGMVTPVNRFTLDTVIEGEGANLSVGERSLLSLARALVKDSRVVVLDEATASVDLETDSKIQYTIQTEFKGRTLLCIAHRLRTILAYDRILVLDAGEVAEFDTPLNLFNTKDSIFRGMCQRSNITADEIEQAMIRINKAW